MRVLVACEFSGVVRDAFIRRGHHAVSCDLLPSETSGPHFRGRIQDFLSAQGSWDLVIAHPPCTRLTNAGAKHLYQAKWVAQGDRNVFTRRKEHGIDMVNWRAMLAGVKFFNYFLRLNVERVCVENPIMHSHARSRLDRSYSQIVQPNWFGHAETKATCLWLKGLPLLLATDRVQPDLEKYPAGKGNGFAPVVHMMSPSPKSDPGRRMRERSRTVTGMADAMAEQWGSL